MITFSTIQRHITGKDEVLVWDRLRLMGSITKNKGEWKIQPELARSLQIDDRKHNTLQAAKNTIKAAKREARQ